MMTEANRLAAVLHDVGIGCRDGLHWHFADADALLAHGVRVVDTDTLAEALGVVNGTQPQHILATRILAALDSEADR